MLDNFRNFDQFEDYFRDIAEFIEKAFMYIINGISGYYSK